jgi:acyl-CoA synthetase (NDP forming)
MIGLGGVFTEVMNDASFCRAPVSYESALAAIARLRGSRLLSGYRGAEPVDQDRLADMLERLAALIVANPGIAEIDLNPVIADGTRIVCVDALIRCTLDRDSI